MSQRDECSQSLVNTKCSHQSKARLMATFMKNVYIIFHKCTHFLWMIKIKLFGYILSNHSYLVAVCL